MQTMRFGVVVASLAVGLVASACGDSDGGGADGTDTGTDGGSGDGGSTGDGGDGGSTGDGGDGSSGDDGGETGDSGDSTGGTGSTGDSGTTSDEDVECPDSPLPPGLHPLTLTHDGTDRVYDLYIPASHDGTEPTPLVFNLHPLTLGGLLHGIWTTESGMNDKSEEGGFIVLQPDGTGTPASWNAGDDCCAPANTTGIDDIGFLMALADEVATMACIDPKRIYSMGMSNGSYLSHRLACEQSSFVAAIGPVVGSLSVELECELDRAVPVTRSAAARILCPHERPASRPGATSMGARTRPRRPTTWATRPASRMTSVTTGWRSPTA